MFNVQGAACRCECTCTCRCRCGCGCRCESTCGCTCTGTVHRALAPCTRTVHYAPLHIARLYRPVIADIRKNGGQRGISSWGCATECGTGRCLVGERGDRRSQRGGQRG